MNAARSVLLVCLLLASCASSPDLDRAAWQVGSCGVDASLRGLAAVSERVAYVGGANGTLRKTVDGGRTWLDVAPPKCGACDFRDVEALSADVVVAMVAGQPARIYRSEDGGVRWRLVHEDPRPQAFFDAVAFRGEHGVVFGDAIDGRFCLLETVDGGRTWRDVPGTALPAPGEGEAAFAASGTCLVAARGAFSLVTGGGPTRHVRFVPGAVVEAAALPMRAGAASRGAFSVAWRGARVVAVGGDYLEPEASAGTACWSVDGGRTWTPADALGYRSGVAWISGDELLAVGSHGASCSRDGGVSWQPFGAEAFHSVAQAPDGAVWACGANGRVARLTTSR
ncbi:MAG: oxidoreductase [Planctomycetes bacterium]|nr:oxidoreductase [Planctomycetota bacterium]